jgi:hypothetical protein
VTPNHLGCFSCGSRFANWAPKIIGTHEIDGKVHLIHEAAWDGELRILCGAKPAPAPSQARMREADAPMAYAPPDHLKTTADGRRYEHFARDEIGVGVLRAPLVWRSR